MMEEIVFIAYCSLVFHNKCVLFDAHCQVIETNTQKLFIFHSPDWKYGSSILNKFHPPRRSDDVDFIIYFIRNNHIGSGREAA